MSSPIPIDIDVDDDYGFFYEDDDNSLIATPRLRLNTQQEKSKRDDFHSHSHSLGFTPFYCGIDLAISFCGSHDDDLDIFVHPPILTPIAVEAITEDLPWSMQDLRWDRLFSSRDGTSFLQFMRCVRGRDNTLFVAKTSCGKIVGGFATGLWSGHKTQDCDREDDKKEFLFVVEPMTPKAPKSQVVANTFIPGLDFHGRSPTSAANLFSFQRGRNNEKIPHRVNIFKSARRMKQTCRIGGKCISMSEDDGSLSLELNNSFKSGTWRINGNEETFIVLEFEVYGFTEN